MSDYMSLKIFACIQFSDICTHHTDSGVPGHSNNSDGVRGTKNSGVIGGGPGGVRGSKFSTGEKGGVLGGRQSGVRGTKLVIGSSCTSS